MIPANKGGPLGWVVDRYLRRKVRSAFRAVWLRGVLPSAAEGPLLVYANHGSFWDGFIAHQLCAVAGWDGYCLMEEANLARYRFLTRVGAFSIRPGDPRSAVQSLRAARSLLQRPASAVFLFPEGVLRPFGAGPLQFQRGLELLARQSARSGVRLLPLALRFAFFEAELPDVLVEAGAPHGVEPTQAMQARLQTLVDGLAAQQSTQGFRPVVAGSPGAAQRWDAVRGRGSPSRGGLRSRG